MVTTAGTVKEGVRRNARHDSSKCFSQPREARGANRCVVCVDITSPSLSVGVRSNVGQASIDVNGDSGSTGVGTGPDTAPVTGVIEALGCV